MTFRVSLLIDADGKAAVQEVRRVEKAQKDAAKASETLNSKSRGAAGGVGTLGTSAGSSAGQVDTMADANRRAAGSMANLTAQGNDVITMLIAGQNPMQLAIQQGTQINQVWGQMGVKGKDAFKLVGGAIMSMLSPINLITIGSIAAAGAMANWFANSGPEAKTLEEAVSDLEAAMTAYTEAADAAEVSTDDLREKFGSAAGEVRKLLEQQRETARRDLTFKIKAVIETDLDETSLDLPKFDFGDQRRLAKEFELSLFGFDATARRERQALVNEVLRDYGELARSAEGSVADQIAAIEDLLGSYSRAAQASGEITQAENDRIGVLQNLLVQLREIAAFEQADDGLPVGQREAMEEYYASRIRGEEFLANARAREAADLMANYQLYAQSRIESDANLAAAQAMLGELEQQVELQRLIALYGEDSAEVADHRAAAERAAFEEMLATHDVAESLKDQMRAAFEQGQSLANLDVGAGIRGAEASAVALAEKLGIAVSLARQIAALGGAAGASGPDEARRQVNNQFNMEDLKSRGLVTTIKFPRVSSRGGGGGGGRRGGGGSSRASATDREREAVEKLISGLEDQLAILRETDPVQKEMLRNREALKGATEAEREAVRGLIETRLDEEEALERHADLADYLKDTGFDLFTGATQGADALASAANRAAEALAEAVFQAILLGEGPLAGILGGGDGGLLGGLADALAGALSGAPARAAGGMVGEPAPRKSDRRTGWHSVEARAAGGMIYGRGDGTSDDNLTWLSSGEYVVNAKSTARNRGLLERINSGEDFPRFAAGGGVSGGTTSPGAVQVAFSIDNRSSVPVQGEIEEVPAQGGGRAYKMVLSDMVGSALSTPGGGARRTLKDGFGVKPRGTRR